MTDIATLGIRIDSKDADAAARALGGLEQQSRKTEGATRQVETATKSAAANFEKLRVAVVAAASSYALLKLVQLAQDFAMASLAMDRMTLSLKSATGSAAAAAREMAYIRAEAQRLGLALESQGRAYSKLSAAAMGTTLQGEGVRKIFSAVSEASAALYLSSEESAGALYAIGQMMSKGTVQAEELRGQLGERLPGAFQAAARAMGTTTAGLGKMLEQGQVISADFLPKFAAELHKTFGVAATEAADSGQGAINRFNTSLFEAKSTVGQTIMESILPALKLWTEVIQILAKEWREFMKGPNSTDIFNKQIETIEGKIGDLERYKKFVLWGDTEGQATADKQLTFLRTQLELVQKTLALEKAGGFISRTTTPAPPNVPPPAGESDEDRRKREAEEKRYANTIFHLRVDTAMEMYERTTKLKEEAAKREGKIDEEYEIALQEHGRTATDTYIKWLQKRLEEETRVSQAGIAAGKLRGEEEEAERQKRIERETKTAGDVDALYATYISNRENEGRRVEAEGARVAAATHQEYAWMLNEAAQFYSEIEGYEAKYLEFAFAAIDAEAEYRKARYGDDVAWAKWAADQKLLIEQELWEKKLRILSQGFGDLENAFRDIARLYARGSDDAKKWEEAARNMEMAQRAVAVVNAVAAIANQGLGDPYTAFARIAAMTAAMGSLLSSAGLSLSGGGAGGASVSVSAAYGQNTTVFGGANNQGSESIENIWKLLEDTYDLEKRTLTGIYENIKELNTNITGIVKTVVLQGIGNVTAGMIESAMPGWERLTREYFGGTIGDLSVKINDAIASIPIIGGVLESLGSWLVGGSGGEKSIQSSGIRIFGGAVNPYDIIHTAGVNPSWGFGGSDEYNTRIDRAANSALTAFFYGEHGLSTTIGKMFYDVAEGLGKDAVQSRQIIIDAFLNLGDINLLGADTSEKIQEIITEKISALEDVAARSIFGNEFINKYIKTNEGAAETVFRLYIDLESVTDILSMTAKSATINTIDLSESLITLAGDLKAIKEAASVYYDKFFSDAEKQTRLQQQLSAALSDMNMALPDTRAGYRSLVEALDLTTESGQKAYVALLKASEAADQYYSALEKQYVDAQNAVISGMQRQIDTASDLARTYGSLSDTLQNTMKQLWGGQMSPLSPGAKYRAAGTLLESTFSGAMGGSVASLTALPQAANDFLAASKATATSSNAYARDFARVVDYLSRAQAVSTAKATEATSQTTALQTALESIKVSSSTTADAVTDLQMNGIDAVLALTNFIEFVADAEGIPDDLRQMIINQMQTYQVVMIAALAGDTPDDVKQILIDQAGHYIAAVQAALDLAGSDPAALTIALGATGDYVATVKALISSDSATLAALELLAATTIDRYVTVHVTTVDESSPAGGGGTDDTAARAAQAAYDAQKAVSDQLKLQWGGFAWNNRSSEYAVTQEDVAAGTAFNVHGYYSYSDAERAWLDRVSTEYRREFQRTRELWQAIPGHALGGIASGLSLVGERGPEIADFRSPARIYPADQTRAVLSGADIKGLLDEIKALRAEVRELRKSADSTAKNTGNTDYTIQAVANGARAFTTEAAS